MNIHDKKISKSIDLNIIGTANVVKICEKYKIKLIYFSTNYIYPGKKGNYKENDPILPINSYAWSKLGGECAVRLYKNSLILRTNFFGKSISQKPSYTDWLIENYKRNPHNKIQISKSFFSPLNLETLIDLIEKAFFKYKLYGIFNLGSLAKIDKLEFSKKFLNIKFNNNENLQRSFSNFDNIFYVNTTAAIRPNDMSLNCKKFINEVFYRNKYQ